MVPVYKAATNKNKKGFKNNFINLFGLKAKGKSCFFYNIIHNYKCLKAFLIHLYLNLLK